VLKRDARTRAGNVTVWVEFPSPFSLDAGTVRLREPSGGVTPAHIERLRRGTLGQPYLLDDDELRRLYFTADAVQSAMRIADPVALVCRYTRKMMAFLLFVPDPRHIVILGLGGGSLAKYCYRHLPRARITAVEVDAGVIALRREFAIPDDDERFEVVHADAAEFIERTRLRPDVVLVDAFDAEGVAPSLASPVFHTRVSQCLAPGGLMVMNLAGARSRYRAHIGFARDAFPGGTLLVPVEGDENRLLFGLPTAPVLPSLPALRARAAELARALDMEFPRYLRRLLLARQVGGAPVFPPGG
jgi:spermidine synthase